MASRHTSIKSAAGLLALLRENPTCRYVSGDAVCELRNGSAVHITDIEKRSEADHLLEESYSAARRNDNNQPVIYGFSCHRFALAEFHHAHGGDREHDAFDDWHIDFALIVAREPELVARLEEALARQDVEFHAMSVSEGLAHTLRPRRTQRGIVDEMMTSCWGSGLPEFEDGRGSPEERRAGLAEEILKAYPEYVVFRDWRPGDPLPAKD